MSVARWRQQWQRGFSVTLAAVLLANCGGYATRTPPGPLEQRAARPGEDRRAAAPAAGRVAVAGWHLVVKGDTLYSIAWRHGLDYRQVAEWNGIGPPYTIFPGDRLRLRPAPPAAAAAAGSAPDKMIPRDPPAPPARAAAQPQEVANAPRPNISRAPPGSVPLGNRKLSWRWPADGKIKEVNSSLGRKGMAIQGRYGQPILAAESGEVVYSGSGLTGYGKLIIIRHNETFLSAYAHNSRLMVSEGSFVKAGQQIAEMGIAGPDTAMLHFEIRRNGEPVSPGKYLPRRNL